MRIYPTIKDPSHVVHRWVCEFELVFSRRTNLAAVENWMSEWWWLSIPCALLYILLTFLGQAWMKKRNLRFELRGALIIWNTFLTIFSFWGACRCVPELIHSLTRHGLQHSLCNPVMVIYYLKITGNDRYTIYRFKTAGVVLFALVSPFISACLLFLQNTSQSYGLFAPSGRWFTSMNLCVHTIMYGYFALTAARFSVPRFLKQSITILQTLQMLIGFLVNLIVLKYKQDGYSCMTPYGNIYVSLAMYASYFLLFAQLFYSSYVQKGTKKITKERKD